MITTERVKKYNPKEPLSTELRKCSKELFVLAVLKWYSPLLYATMVHSDCPDLQDFEKRVGVEVVCFLEPNEAKATAEFVKYLNPQKDCDKEKAEQQIIAAGGDVISAPCGIDVLNVPSFSESIRKKQLKAVFQNKSSKASAYLKAFKHIKLAILADFEPSDMFDIWISCIRETQSIPFEEIFLICKDALYCWNSNGGFVEIKRIPDSVRQDLKKIGHMTAIGVIDESDVEWHEY